MIQENYCSFNYIGHFKKKFLIYCEWELKHGGVKEDSIQRMKDGKNVEVKKEMFEPLVQLQIHE